MKNINKLTRFLHDNKIISAIFLFSLAFFIYQHSTGFSWDFSTYVLNSKYWVNQSHYFEWARPPLPSAILLPFGFASWLFAEYVYIVIMSFLHLFSCIKFSEKFAVDRTAFYVFSMNVFVLVFGFKMGTELLSLALVQLFLAHLYERRSGMFYSLSVLARYTGINLIILLLFQRNIKKIVLSLFLAAVVLLPWLVFSYAKTGNALISFLDSYALNYNFRIREGVSSPFLLEDILFAFNFTIPLFLLGLLSKRNRNYYIMLLVLVFSILSYATIPLKETRYLFLLAIPAAYFSTLAIKKLSRTLIIYSFVFLTALSLILLPATLREQENPALYKFVAGKNISCTTESNVWVALNYYGMPSEPHPEKTQLAGALNDGYVVVLFKNPKYPEYIRNESFLRQPVLEETGGYVILAGESCKPKEKFELVFIDRVKDYYKTLDENITKCEIALPENICNLLRI